MGPNASITFFKGRDLECYTAFKKILTAVQAMWFCCGTPAATTQSLLQEDRCTLTFLHTFFFPFFSAISFIHSSTCVSPSLSLPLLFCLCVMLCSLNEEALGGGLGFSLWCCQFHLPSCWCLWTGLECTMRPNSHWGFTMHYKISCSVCTVLQSTVVIIGCPFIQYHCKLK